MKLSGWGNFPVHEAQVSRPRHLEEVIAALEKGPAIARGNGRSYGDSSVSPGNTIDMRRINRMISFDPDTGVLVAEAGVMLSDVIHSFLPRGWFPLVTPGTRLITLGGAIASDVHGKNHHLDGSFRNSVEWIDILGADGQITRASRVKNPDLFGWTIGGMGLTGVILRCAMQLRPVSTAWIRQRTLATANLDEAMDQFEAHLDKRYSVAWIDCAARGAKLGRSLIILGDHAEPGEVPVHYRKRVLSAPIRKKRIFPFPLPGWVLNPYSIRAFNVLYHWKGGQGSGHAIVDWDSYFYPLDAIRKWNRLYGRRGFMQFQCVLPLETARQGLTRLLQAISASGQASFLSVLKRMGAQDSPMSFPLEGYTLALDFPNTAKARALMAELDAITLDHQGRFYLTKDSRLPAKTLAAADPRAANFARWREENGLSSAFASAQSERLNL